MTPESPQFFIVREECQKAAWQNGYRRALGEKDDWAHYGSTTAQGALFLAAAGAHGPWFLALDHQGVIAELGLSPSDISGPAHARYAFPTLGDLYPVLSRVYELGVSLPDIPLQVFRDKTAKLPQSTEAERLVVQRVGQDIFRASLIDYWQGRCPLTGIMEPALLRASHIIPWSACQTDADRLDVHNGLLLSALWDAAFDRGLVTFTDQGEPVFSPSLSTPARTELRWLKPLTLSSSHQPRLAWHRENVFMKGEKL